MPDPPKWTHPSDSNSTSTRPFSRTRLEFGHVGQPAAPSRTAADGRDPAEAATRASGWRIAGAGARAVRSSLARHAGAAAMIISLLALVLSSTMVADAARQTPALAAKVKPHESHTASLLGHPVSAKPYSHGILLLGSNRKFPASAIPTVNSAKDASKLDGMTAEQVAGSCPADTVDLGTWCLESSPYSLTNSEIGMNDYVWASRKCIEEGGYLPSASQLVGAANRVKLESTIHDSPLTATIPLDPTYGLKDQREMSSTLVTTQAGPEAAGSEGVSAGSTGNPQTGEPDPVPQPAVPYPETLQYVTVYSDGQKGGFAGSEPVSQPENFRCAYNKSLGALEKPE
jgi:hypothetical protein